MDSNHDKDKFPVIIFLTTTFSIVPKDKRMMVTLLRPLFLGLKVSSSSSKYICGTKQGKGVL